ncbi:MAG TPA: DUF3883 domain-containing protein [Clostridiaceae bacterium]|nr:DUF3883 domain-containing protein [Clostridiaceae bacterium]
MEEYRKLGLLIAYYLSKYDREGLKRLGYNNFTQAYDDIGNKLNVKPNTVKNWRDEFDPLHGNDRHGWYQRELRPSRLEVVEKYKYISEDAFTQIVREILSTQHITEKFKFVEIISGTIGDKKQASTKEYTSSGLTGKRAEEIFLDKFSRGEINGFSGNLIDTRNDGCGYDFKLDSSSYVFEVKGLAGCNGGIRFTDKEWATAKKLKGNYILVLVSNIQDKPTIKMIIDPYSRLSANKQTYTTIAVEWHVNSNQLVDDE